MICYPPELTYPGTDDVSNYPSKDVLDAWVAV